MKVLAFDVGFNLGWGLVQHDGPVRSGTQRVPGSVENFGLSMFEAEGFIRMMVGDLKPDLIMVAEPWIRRFPPATAASLRPIMAFEGLVEKIAFELGIECKEENEARVRGYFDLPNRPSAVVKQAAIMFCRERGWKANDEHAADALVMAAYGLAISEPDRQHELLPIFQKRKALA